MSDQKKTQNDEQDADTSAQVQALVRAAHDSFLALSAECPHKDRNDCAEPSIEFSCMCCCPANCPLLLDAGL